MKETASGGAKGRACSLAEREESKCAGAVLELQGQRCRRRTWRFPQKRFWGWHSAIQQYVYPYPFLYLCASCVPLWGCVRTDHKNKCQPELLWAVASGPCARQVFFVLRSSAKNSPQDVLLLRSPFSGYSNSCACDKKGEVTVSNSRRTNSQSILLESPPESFLNATRLGAVVFRRTYPFLRFRNSVD